MRPKSTGVAYLLMLFSLIGLCGFQRFYLGKIVTGIIYLFTFGVFGLGLIYDLFTLHIQVKYVNILNGHGPFQYNQQPNIIVNVTTDKKDIE